MPQIGAVGAVIGARNAAANSSPTKPSYSCGSSVSVQEIDKEIAEARYYSKMIKKYDTNLTGKLEEPQVRKLLADLDFASKNSPPSDEELKYIIRLADNKCKNGAIDVSELKTVIVAWHCYITSREAIEEVFAKFDKTGSGMLNWPALKEYLQDLNGGDCVSDAEVNWVMSQADSSRSGSLSKLELCMATAAWSANVRAKARWRCLCLPVPACCRPAVPWGKAVIEDHPFASIPGLAMK